MSKNLKISLLILIVVLLGGFIFYYFFWIKSPPSVLAPGSREAKMQEMSQSLTVQKETPQFKAKLAEMSKSLNK